jgi:hypothetical protein
MCQTVCFNSNDKTPAKPPGSLSYERATGRASPDTKVLSPSISSVRTEHEDVLLSGHCTTQLFESLVDMVNKVTEKAAHLKKDKMTLSQETENLLSLIEPPSPGPFLSAVLGSNASWPHRRPTRTRPVFGMCL